MQAARAGNYAPGFLFVLLAFVALSCAAQGQSAASPSTKPQADAPVDLTGVWSRTHRPPDNARKYTLDQVIMSLGKGAPPMTPWGQAKFNANKPNRGPRAYSLKETNDGVPSCFPPGVPRIYSAGLGLPFEIMQIPGRVVMVFEYDHFVRQIYTDGRPHPPDVTATWMGDAIGIWKGDTLTVDTIGFNDKTWLDALGHPHSEDMHAIERIRRVNHDSITDDITIDDPKTYTKPWVAQIVFDLRPGWRIEEDVCEDAINFSNVEKLIDAPSK